MSERFPIQCLAYGDSGGGKSSFAATFPYPRYVAMFDPKSKATPYRKRGRLVDQYVSEDLGTDVWLINSKKHPDQLSTMVEFFIDADVKAGKSTLYAAEKFDARINQIYQEVREGKWATVIIDSLSGLEYAVRKCSQYKLNPTTNKGNEQHGKVHYGAAAEIIEELVNSKLAHLDCNVVMLAHLRREADYARGSMEYLVAAPGQQASKIAGLFGEVYYQYVHEDGTYLLQTKKGNKYFASSQIPAPYPCIPHYEELWAEATELD